ncbi:hypothetical protein DCMF_12810 [Candidatus Formimonas warabiya]|uniref:Uncharacterized protein n=1 Tax=Formimonas warabiya TaxID=1761012 RepID=A0A3G1KSU4_FORW1|nr:hypothetical protein DCMF_12810 [Candidatus Formimonas warabiya]
MTILQKRKKDVSNLRDLLQQTIRDIPSQCMVIVTNYELIENPQTHFFMSGVQNLSLAPVAVMIIK